MAGYGAVSDVAIERWNHPEREHREPFERKPFVSIDPGTDGYALAWVPDEDRPAGYCHALDPMALIELFILVGATVGVVESQYVTSLKNARHILELSFRSGMSLGWLAGAMQAQVGADLHLFEVAPATWQAYQRRRAGVAHRLARGEGIELALAAAEDLIGTEGEWRKARKKQREGLASACGIGMWWRSLWEPV